MRRAIGMAVVVLMSGGCRGQTSTAAKPAPAASPEERTIPVDPPRARRSRPSSRSTPGRRSSSSEREGRAEARPDRRSGMDAASGDFNRRKADLEAAQKTIQAELKKAVSPRPSRSQEWKTWATAQAERPRPRQ